MPAARSRAASRSSSSLAALPQLLKGEFSRKRRRRHRQLVDPPADRRRAPASHPSISPQWCRCGCSRSPSHAAIRSCSSPRSAIPSCPLLLAELLGEAGLPDGVFNVVNGDKKRSTRCSRHPDVAAISFVGRRRSRSTCTERPARTASACRRSAAPRITWWSCPMRISTTAVERFVGRGVRLGRRALHGDLGGGGGGRRPATGWSSALRAHGAQALKIGPGTTPRRDMGPLVTAQHRERVSGYIERASTRARSWWSTGGAATWPGHENGFFLGATLFDHVTPEMTHLSRGNLRPGAVRRAGARRSRTALELVNAHEFANGAAIFTRERRRPRANSRRRSQIGMVGRQRADSRADGLPQLRRLEALAVRRSLHMHGPEGVRFYTRLKTVTARWPGQGSGQADFGIPTLR